MSDCDPVDDRTTAVYRRSAVRLVCKERDDAIAALTASRERCKALEGALEEALEFVENQEDVVDGDYGEPRPNLAMQLARVLRALLRQGDAAGGKHE